MGCGRSPSAGRTCTTKGCGSSLSWGRRKGLQYVKYDVPSKSYLSSKKYRSAIPWEGTMSKLPVPLLRLIGRVAYRHVG
jgi:hypothetical protein